MSGVRIDGYLIDATLSQTHAHEAEPTSYAVEQGSDVTDNVRVLPRQLTIEGVVSDTPTGLAKIERGAGGAVVQPSREARARLEAILLAREPVMVETQIRAYDNMVLYRLEEVVDSSTGAALKFTAQFQQLRIIENRRVAVRTAEPRARRRRDLGTRPATTAPPATSVYVGGDNLPHRVQYDPAKGRYVDADTGKALSPAEAQRWVDQNGGDPQYRSPRDAGPGGTDPQASAPPGAREKPDGYWAQWTGPDGAFAQQDELARTDPLINGLREDDGGDWTKNLFTPDPR